MTTNADTVASDGACSLREAVQAANTDAPVSDCPAGSGADQISLGATTYTLSAGQLDVTSELTITGTGAASTTIDGNHTGRVLNVTAAGKLTLDGVLITGGQTGNGTDGLATAGHDPFTSVSGGSGSDGGNGGGIANAGALTIRGSRVSGNTTGNGGKGGDATGAPGQTTPTSHPDGGFAFGGMPGAGGRGGGVYSTGTLTITGTTIDANTTGTGGTGGNATGGQAVAGAFTGGGGHGRAGGQGGLGGGVYGSGATTITGCTITGNTTGNGGDGGDGHGPDGNGTNANAGGGTGGDGGFGGDGGGIWAMNLTAADNTVTGNTAGAGAFGGQGFGGIGSGSGASGDGKGGKGGIGGNGGGAFAALSPGGSLSLDRSLLASNHTGKGGHGGTARSGGTTKGGDGGTGGSGGGLLAQTNASVNNVTFVANTAGAGGDRGTGPPLDPNGSADFGKGGNGGDGGAADVFVGTLGLINATITGNSQGGAGAGNPNGTPGVGSLNTMVGTSLAVSNSILDGSCGSVSDAGGNLFTFGSAGCPGTVGDPKLGPLQDNGGATKTMAIGTTGDAFDKLAPNSSGQCRLPSDQRGATRPSRAACDIGAYEVAPPTATTGDATAAGVLVGALDPRGLKTRWYFEYGTTASYGGVTPDQFATTTGSVSATLTGLSPQMTYHYRLVASGPDGTSMGADRTFTTSMVPPPSPLAPKITGLTLKPKKFRVSGKKPLGTKISYRDSLAAVTTFTVLKRARGVRVKGKCLKPSKKRHGKRCTRYVAVGSFRHADVAGANALRWRGKLGGHKLTPGSYRLRAVPVAGLLAGKPLASSFRVIR